MDPNPAASQVASAGPVGLGAASLPSHVKPPALKLLIGRQRQSGTVVNERDFRRRLAGSARTRHGSCRTLSERSSLIASASAWPPLDFSIPCSLPSFTFL